MVLASDPSWVKEWPARIGGPGFKIYMPGGNIGTKGIYSELPKSIPYVTFGYTPKTDSYFTITENTSFTVVFVVKSYAAVPGILLYGKISVQNYSNAYHLIAGGSSSGGYLYFTDGSSTQFYMSHFYENTLSPSARLSAKKVTLSGIGSFPQVIALTIHQGWLTYWLVPGYGNRFDSSSYPTSNKFPSGKTLRLMGERLTNNYTANLSELLIFQPALITSRFPSDYLFLNDELTYLYYGYIVPSYGLDNMPVFRDVFPNDVFHIDINRPQVFYNLSSTSQQPIRSNRCYGLSKLPQTRYTFRWLSRYPFVTGGYMARIKRPAGIIRFSKDFSDLPLRSGDVHNTGFDDLHVSNGENYKFIVRI